MGVGYGEATWVKFLPAMRTQCSTEHVEGKLRHLAMKCLVVELYVKLIHDLKGAEAKG